MNTGPDIRRVQVSVVLGEIFFPAWLSLEGESQLFAPSCPFPASDRRVNPQREIICQLINTLIRERQIFEFTTKGSSPLSTCIRSHPLRHAYAASSSFLLSSRFMQIILSVSFRDSIRMVLILISNLKSGLGFGFSVTNYPLVQFSSTSFSLLHRSAARTNF